MTIWRGLMIVATLTIVAGGGTAQAACVNGWPSVQEEVGRSDVIVVGRVTAEETTPDSGQFLEGTTYTVAVEEALRGERSKTIALFSEHSSGGFLMQIGAMYIVLAYRDGGRLLIDNCGNSAPLPQRADVLSIVRKALKGGAERR